MWIELLKPAGDLKPGFHDVADEAVARAYIAAGLAKDAGDGPDKIILQRSMEHLRGELSAFTRGVAQEIQDAAQHVRRPRVEVIQDEADKTRGVGDYCRNVFLALCNHPEESGPAHERLVKVYGSKRSMAEASGSTGGYSTPVLYESSIFKVAAETAIVRPRARNLPLGARQTEWPALDQYRTPSAGQSAMFAGVQVYRKGENVQRTASDPKLTNIVLLAQDLTALTQIGRDTLMDSTGLLDSLIPDLIGGAIGWREDWEALLGTGSGQLLGVLNAPCTIQYTRAGGGSTFSYLDAVAMQKYLLPMSSGNACWVIHPYMMPAIETMQDGSGRYIFIPNAPNVNQGGAGTAVAGFLKGLPIIKSEKSPAPGNPGDVMLCDFSQYLLGTRSGLELGLSEHFAYDTDQITFRAKLRNDGQPALKKAITLADGAGTNKVSAFVALN